MLNQTAWNKDLPFSETDIAFIVLSDVKAIEPVAGFENRQWEYALVFISYNSTWEYQKLNTQTNQPATCYKGKYTVKSLHVGCWTTKKFPILPAWKTWYKVSKDFIWSLLTSPFSHARF